MALRAENISSGYDRPVVVGVKASISRGEFTAIVGPNGAGKTTLLKTLSGLLKPLQGKVYFNGIDFYKLARSERAKLASYLPPSIARSIDTTTVFDLLLAARIPHTPAFWVKPSKRDLEVIERVVEALGLEEFVSRRLVTLSSGELQRVLIGFSLAKESEAIFADEPTAFLDLHYKVNVFSLLRSLAREGKIVVAATHELFIVPKFADKILLIKDGRIVATGRPSEILRKSLLREVFDIDIEVEINNGHIIVKL